MRKLRVKLRNATIYPPWGPIKKKKVYSSLIWNAKLVPKVTFERYQGDKSRIWKIRGLTFTILRKLSRCVSFLGKGVGNHFYMAKRTLIYRFSDSYLRPSILWGCQNPLIYRVGSSDWLKTYFDLGGLGRFCILFLLPYQMICPLSLPCSLIGACPRIHPDSVVTAL